MATEHRLTAATATARHARERACYTVMLLTGSDASRNHGFHERCGFDRDGTTGFVRYLDGE